MSIEEIYEQVEQFILQSIPIEKLNDWEKAELNLELQPNMVSFHGKYYSRKKESPLEIRDKKRNRLICEVLKRLHRKTIGGEPNKWNKAQFVISPTAKLSARYEWDQKWHEKEEEVVKDLQKEDPNYVGPKWHWEEV